VGFFVLIQIASALDHGKIVPEEIIFALLSKRLEDGYYRGETGFILDGIPRTRMQAVSVFSITTFLNDAS
jgi:adenylate kinase